MRKTRCKKWNGETAPVRWKKNHFYWRVQKSATKRNGSKPASATLCTDAASCIKFTDRHQRRLVRCPEMFKTHWNYFHTWEHKDTKDLIPIIQTIQIANCAKFRTRPASQFSSRVFKLNTIAISQKLDSPKFDHQLIIDCLLCELSFNAQTLYLTESYKRLNFVTVLFAHPIHKKYQKFRWRQLWRKPL